MAFGVHLMEVEDEQARAFVLRTFEPTERGVHALISINVRVVGFPFGGAHAAHRRADSGPEPRVGGSALFYGGDPDWFAAPPCAVGRRWAGNAETLFHDRIVHVVVNDAVMSGA
jgi:hypothetical protein